MDKSKWEYKKLGDCFAYIKNGANIKQVNGATGIPITRIETLSNDVFNRDRMGYANIDDVSPYSSNILNDGDILMSHINSMKFLGRAVEYKKIDEEVIIHGMNLLRMIPTSNFLSSYAVYQFKTDHFRKQIKAISHQAVNQASFNVTNLKGLNLIVPPVDDQQRIVAELDCLNEMIALKHEQLKEFDKLAQSIFYDMFGDPLKTSKWDKVKLGDVCKTSSGGTPTSSNASYYENGNIGWLRSGDITTHIWKNNAFITEAGMANSSAKLFPINTVVVAMYGATVGQVGILHIETTTNQAVCGIYPNEHFNPIYLCYHFICIKPQLIKSAIGGAQPNISQAVIKKLDIPIPPLALQQQFAEKIQAIEEQKELVKKSIAETQQLLDSRMDFYFD